VEIEEECLRTLALHQPVAVDLRLIVSALKINSALEQIGDLAVNITHKTLRLLDEPEIEIPFDLSGMWQKTQAMLRDSLDSLVNMDAALAADVIRRDDEIDQMKRDNRVLIEGMIAETPERTVPLLRLMAVSRNLERIADGATNIADDVIYMIEGRIVRHREVP
ncbi:MAG: phosphate signaling complex protein PhoU, partial [Pirellulales bacterium]